MVYSLLQYIYYDNSFTKHSTSFWHKNQAEMFTTVNKAFHNVVYNCK